MFGEKPKDAITPEELKERRITIVSDGIETGFRPGVFDKQGLLRDFQLGGKNKLLIFVVNQPSLSQESFGDGVFDSYREIINRIFSPHDLVQTRNDLKERVQNSPGFASSAEEYSLLIDRLSDEELVQLGLINSLRGYTFPAGHKKGLPDTGLVFVAMGERPIIMGLGYFREVFL